MPLQSPFRWKKADNRMFLQQFTLLRHSSDLRFLALHAFATVCYISKVVSPSAQFVGLAGAVVPLLALLSGRPKFLGQVPRSLLVLMVKLSVIYVSPCEFVTDWSSPSEAGLPLLELTFKSLVTARVFVYLCVGLGLQLPAIVDLPLQLLGVGTVALATIPRQCGSGGGGSGDRLTLFQLNQPAFKTLANWLDWPFAPLVVRQEALDLSDRALCTALYAWVQLVVAFGVPATVLWASEWRERQRFLHLKQQQQQQQQAQRRQEGECLQPSVDAPTSPAAVPGGSGGSASAATGMQVVAKLDHCANMWLYFAFASQAAWCIIRTACKLAL